MLYRIAIADRAATKLMFNELRRKISDWNGVSEETRFDRYHGGRQLSPGRLLGAQNIGG